MVIIAQKGIALVFFVFFEASLHILFKVPWCAIGRWVTSLWIQAIKPERIPTGESVEDPYWQTRTWAFVCPGGPAVSSLFCG